MNIDLTEQDREFEREVRGFLEANAYQSGTDYNAWRLNWFAQARERGGWDVPKWPVEFGGPGWSPTQHYIWERETARANIPWDLPFGLSMLAPVLMAHGSAEQQRRFLPDIRERKVNWCQGYSEPGAGSDLANLATKAELASDGSHYLVNGTKMWTTLAHIADWMFCLTRTRDTGKKQEGITFLVFPMKQAGIEVKPIITLGGAHSVNMVHLSDVEVPIENRIGEENEGWTYAKGLLQHERTGLAGISKSIVALSRLKEQARSSERGAGTLLDDPGYRRRVAELEIELMATEFTELRGLAAAMQGAQPGPESSLLKLKGTEIQQRLERLTMDAAGIFAPAWGGLPLGPRFARRGTSGYLSARAYTIYGGASEVQRDVIAKNVLDIKPGGGER